MSDLVEWLTKILDEDEDLANEVVVQCGADWYNGEESVSSHRDGYIACGPYNGALGRELGEMIVRHDPTHVVADIAAKRAILALHREVGFSTFTLSGQREMRKRYCDVCQKGDEDELTYPCPTLRLVASAYADRPGYDEAWRP